MHARIADNIYLRPVVLSHLISNVFYLFRRYMCTVGENKELSVANYEREEFSLANFCNNVFWVF